MKRFVTKAEAQKLAWAKDAIVVKVFDVMQGKSFWACRYDPETDEVYL